MRILYQMPLLNTIYAGRTIYNGYKNAFIGLGHQFETLTAGDDSEKKFDEFAPDIFFTCLSRYYLKFLNLTAVKKHKRRGMKVYANLPFWNSPVSRFRINESPSLSKNTDFIRLIKSGDFGDIYYNVCEAGDSRMIGFEEVTGQKHHTVPLAADSFSLSENVYDEKFKADISFLGTHLPEKKHYFQKYVFPLRKKYILKLFGQDWTLNERIKGWIQRGGQYFNVPYLKSINKPKFTLEDEAKIYRSSIISINVHEEHQRKFGGDCNERTFKIPFCGGFEVTDNVECIRKYFVPDKEIIIAENEADWFEKIKYFINNPNKRIPIIRAGRKRVLREHTYHHRINSLLSYLKQ